MHIINLAIKCKNATGDGTKIVCMNSDYVVRISAEDCGTFSSSPVKKLIVKHNKEYYESDIKTVLVKGEPVLQAVLPPLENTDYVDLGVCGKQTDDPGDTPTYTSTSARYECSKSVLSGTAVLKTDPVFSGLKVDKNGVYSSGDYGADGFHTVTVQIPVKIEESRAVELFMPSVNQVVTPTQTGRVLKEVIIKKPTTLIPANIKKGVVVGGVLGEFEEESYLGTMEINDTIDETFIV